MPKLLVFGIDGGTWDIVDPLINRGALPNLSRLKRGGTHCVLRSLDSPIISPAVWTSIASGKTPDKHGVKDFVISSKSVRCKRIWDIAEQVGLSVGMSGYLVTWPPRPINGFMIPGSFAQGPETYPPLLSFVREMDMSERSGGARLSTYWNFARQGLQNGLRWSTLLSAIAVFLKNKSRQTDFLDSFFNKRIVGLRVYADIVLRLCQQYRPDVLLFVSSLTDSISHNYWKYQESLRYGSRLSASEVSKHGGKVRQAYIEVDRLLGRLLALCDSDTYVMVVSDHGFQSVLDEHDEALDRILQIKPGVIRQALNFPSSVRAFSVRGRAYFRDRSEDRRLEVGLAEAIAGLRTRESGKSLFNVRVTASYVEVGLNPQIANYKEVSVLLPNGSIKPGGDFVAGINQTVSGVHHPDGIMLFTGPGVFTGREISSASVLDLTPTLLYALGLPVGRDMDGKVIVDAFEEDLLRNYPVKYTDSWEEAERDYEEDTEEESEILTRRLRGLGYL